MPLSSFVYFLINLLEGYHAFVTFRIIFDKFIVDSLPKASFFSRIFLRSVVGRQSLCNVCGCA